MLYSDKTPVTGPGLDTFSFPSTDAVFVVGDSHGQSAALRALLDGIGLFNTGSKKRTLVFAGDLIDRGPDSFGCLDAAFFEAASRARADKVVFLPGNHELMLVDGMDAMDLSDEDLLKSKGATSWMVNGGLEFLKEGFESRGVKAPTDIVAQFRMFSKMFKTPTGQSFNDFVRTWPSHFRMGDMLAVHAGINPKKSLRTVFELSQEEHIIARDHWAWIRSEFLSHQTGFDDGTGTGLLVVHGHTSPMTLSPRKVTTGPDVFKMFAKMTTNARVCVDGGAANDVGVAAAALTDEGLRVLFSPC